MTRQRDIERERPRPDQRQLEMLRDIGTFRMIDTQHLAQYRYGGSDRAMRADVAQLAGMVETIELMERKADRQLEIVVLTKEGRRMLNLPRFTVRTREAFHDSQVYGAYREAATRIEAKGGTVARVVMDDEMKSMKARETNKKYPGRKENSPLTKPEKERIARELNLKLMPVVKRGQTELKIHIPDVRIEYEDKNGKPQLLDLEVTTSSYRAGSKQAKAAAGFALYSGSGAGSPVWGSHSIWR